MRIVSEPAHEIAHWLASRVQHFEVGSSPYTAIGLRDDRGHLVAAAVYDNFTRINIDTHIAIEHRRALTRHYLGEILRYPFEQLRVERITGRVAASNAASRRFCEHVGFVEEGRCRRALPGGEDLIVFGMLRTECRWLEVGRHGQRVSASGA